MLLRTTNHGMRQRSFLRYSKVVIINLTNHPGRNPQRQWVHYENTSEKKELRKYPQQEGEPLLRKRQLNPSREGPRKCGLATSLVPKTKELHPKLVLGLLLVPLKDGHLPTRRKTKAISPTHPVSPFGSRRARLLTIWFVNRWLDLILQTNLSSFQ